MPPEGRTAREVHRHIGDFTLFWTGLYPEMLKRLRSAFLRDSFIDYCEQGKRLYIASTFEDDPYREEAHGPAPSEHGVRVVRLWFESSSPRTGPRASRDAAP